MKIKEYFLNAGNLTRTAFKMSPSNMFTMIGSAVILSAKSIVEMMVPAFLIDLITRSKSFNKILIAIIVYAVIVLIADSSQKTLSLLSTAFGYTANNKATLIVGQKGMHIDYSKWEDAKTFEKIGKAKSSTWVFSNMVDMLCENWLSAIITMVPVAYVLSQINFIVILLIFLLVVLELWLERQTEKKKYNLDLKKSPYEKKVQYDQKVMSDIRYGKEVRVYDAIETIIKKYENSQKSVFSLKRMQQKEDLKLNYCTLVITCIESIIAFTFAVRKFQLGLIAIPYFILFVSAIQQFTESAETIIETFTYVGELIDYYQNYKCFMEEPESMNANHNKGTKQVIHSPFNIELKNVSFRYPNSDKYALKNISLTIPYGSTLAVVGENGSGKTTLVKLLTRLYNPTEGKILINGVNAKDIEYSDYMKLFSPVFQDYQFNAFSLRENISFLDRNNDEKIWSLIRKQHLERAILNCKNGIDTYVTKQLDEDGVDFSGGEKQRLAMVRAMYKDAPIFILDEPTSAIDPLAELEYFKDLKEETLGKTAIYITHRMASAKEADTVLVMDHGQIVETGTFESLMRLNGIFANSFSLQASYYMKRND